MRVFVTGATGFIGTAIVQELSAHGHEVLGLARGEASAEALRKLGAAVHFGDLKDTGRLAAAARLCDSVIHAAFIHDFTAYAAAAETDLRAVEALTKALAETGKPFVSTSVTVLLEAGRLGHEIDPLPAHNPIGARAAAERAALAAADRGVRSAVVRLPASVHGAGDRAFVPALIAIAREKGFAGYIGDGNNRWPAVHRRDAARLYRLALESAPQGAVLHAVAEEGVTLRSIALEIAGTLGLPVRSVPPEEAAACFGWLAPFVSLDNPVSSARTRAAMGWNPAEPLLIDDMHHTGYFR